MYKTELHCHTNFSGCSDVDAAGVAEKYIAAEYTTVVITNHFNPGHMNREGSFKALVQGTFDAVKAVKECAGDKLNIIAGMELTLKCMPNDFLLYGDVENFVKEVGEEIFDLRPHQVRDRIHEIGGVIIQAHPFRFGQIVVNPADVDGIEVFNGHMGQRSYNEVAKHWALSWADWHRHDGSYILTSGSDHHHTWQQPVAGIGTEEPVADTEQLLAVLKSGNYHRITACLGDVEH